MATKFKKPEYDKDYNAVDYYNRFKYKNALELFVKVTTAIEVDSCTFKERDNIFTFEDGLFSCNTANNCHIEQSKEYTPFMLLSKFMFKGNHLAAFNYVNNMWLNAHIPYVRVGINYFKKIIHKDRFDIQRMELKRWIKDEIKEDHGKAILADIPKYDTFTLVPDNKDYKSIIDNNFNLYNPFAYKPKKGDWLWTGAMLRHVFGDQYEQGLKYLQVLYIHPKQVLPVLVLVSKVRGTGKSTFLDWMSILFGGNMVVISPNDLASQFNSSYATANIVGIEETVTDKSSIIEKLKALSTNKFLNLNQKFIDNTKIPFFAKFIITSNDEKKFMKVDDEEIRFWIRKLDTPKEFNENFLMELAKEIPAFLEHIETMAPVEIKSRMVFTPDEISNKWLLAVKEASHTGLYQDLEIHIQSEFEQKDYPDNEFHASLKDIKDRYFAHDHRITPTYIKKVLQDEFKMAPNEKSTSYSSFGGESKTGRYYKFKREQFVDFDIDRNSVKGEDGLPF